MQNYTNEWIDDLYLSRLGPNCTISNASNFGRYVVYKNIAKLNSIVYWFCTILAGVQKCRYAWSEDWCFSRPDPTSTISNTSNLRRNIVYKFIIKLRSIFTGLALFRLECRSAQMSEVRIDIHFTRLCTHDLACTDF